MKIPFFCFVYTSFFICFVYTLMNVSTNFYLTPLQSGRMRLSNLIIHAILFADPTFMHAALMQHLHSCRIDLHA